MELDWQGRDARNPTPSMNSTGALSLPFPDDHIRTQRQAKVPSASVDSPPVRCRNLSLATLNSMPSRTCRYALALFAMGMVASLPCHASAPAEVIESYIARATDTQPRQSEGDVVVLNEGSLLAAWSDFYEKANDHAPARISASISGDGGRTWGPRFTLQENTGRSNVMSVSLVRSRSGTLLVFYLQKNSTRDLEVWVRRSTDDSKTWGAPSLVTPEAGYHVMNNARVIQLRTGRLLAPVSVTQEVGTKNDNFQTVVYLSDDDGRTWRRGSTFLSAPGCWSGIPTSFGLIPKKPCSARTTVARGRRCQPWFRSTKAGPGVRASRSSRTSRRLTRIRASRFTPVARYSPTITAPLPENSSR
jgi:hypothetical protein